MKSLMLAACLLCLETPGLVAWYLSQGICHPSTELSSGEGPAPRHRRNSESGDPTSQQMFQYLICSPVKPRWASRVTLSAEVPLRQQSKSESFQLRRFANGLGSAHNESPALNQKVLLARRTQAPASCSAHPSLPTRPSTLPVHPDCPRQTRADRAPPTPLWETPSN